jgi:hypothetical protein
MFPIHGTTGIEPTLKSGLTACKWKADHRL